MSTRPVILKVGSASPQQIREFGDFESYFAKGAGRPLSDFHVVEARGQRFDVMSDKHPDDYPAVELPDPRSVDGVIITGSASTVAHHEPWSVRAGEWLREVAAASIPMLGVCYGHQLIGDVFGGEVGLNPNGREIGILEVNLTDAGQSDPLFEGADSPLWLSLTHNDAVNSPPPGAVVLAYNDHTPVQAFAIGDNIRAVQFHPEWEVDAMRFLINERRDAIDSESGAGHAQRLIDSLPTTHDGRPILRNFLRHWLNFEPQLGG